MQAYSAAAGVSFILLASCGSPAASASSQLPPPAFCREPVLPLSQTQATSTKLDREQPKPMTEDMSVARLEVASAYAPQMEGNGVNWCMAYEVTNKGPNAIPLFNWPLPGLKFEDLNPGDGPQGYVLTAPPGPEPLIKDTDLYGFKAQGIKSRAFQAAEASIGPPLITLVASDGVVRDGTSSDAMVRRQAFELENGSRLPALGGRFTGSGAAIEAVSTVSRDHDMYHLNIQVGRNDNKAVQYVVAPITIAFAKLGGKQLLEPSALPPILKDVQTYELLSDGNSFELTMDLSALAAPKIYVIRQPISFIRENKTKVCVLVPTYSPVNIPENLLSCP
jgi:hypothetical protein